MIYEVEISAEEIENNIDGRLIGENCLIKGISIDSRDKSFSPWCFFAIKGKKYNGADFIEEAISKGEEILAAINR